MHAETHEMLLSIGKELRKYHIIKGSQWSIKLLFV